jgi:signal transduction histidine kinase
MTPALPRPGGAPPSVAEPGREPAAESWRAARRRAGADEWQRRRLLERQLHDGASLRVSALALRLGLLREHPPNDSADWAGRINELQDELHAVLQELRDVASKIYPPLLDQAGLRAALRELADQAGLETVLDVPERRFGPAAEGAAYFAVAGCLAARPPDAPPVRRITVERDRDDLVLRMDGVGPRDLRLMLDQARPLGGSAELVDDGVAGTGTITVRIPCE